jgi:copper resistance protein D
MDWLLATARFVQFAASITLFGLFAFDCCLLRRREAGSGARPAPGPGLARRLAALGWASLVLALLSGAVWLGATAANMSGAPPIDALRQGTWSLVLTETQFGKAWQVRLALAGVIAVCLVFRQSRGRPPAAGARWAGFAAAAAFLGALAWAGHGASTPGAPGDLHLAADIMHLLGAGFWIGMLVPLALLLVELRRAGGPLALAAAAAAAHRFSLLAAASVVALLTGGIINTWFLAGSIPALLGTSYGRLLLAKIALFLATLVIASVNLLRLAPRLAAPKMSGEHAAWRAATWLRRNALAEAALGLFVVAIVGVLGMMPPAAHTEPGWPLPFRIDAAAMTPSTRFVLATLVALAGVGAVTLVASAAAARYRIAALLAAAVGLLLGGIWLLLQPAVEPAYPTSFYVPAAPYAVPSIVAGAALYGASCALCHGASGEGDGPAAATSPVRPANLTGAHLFAQTPGDLFWWVSIGRANGAMPGFAPVMTARQRWDVINFIRARAAGVLTRGIAASASRARVPSVPDFAFESGGSQSTLRQTLQQSPALLVLFAAPMLPPHVALLIRQRSQLAAAGLHIIAVDIAAPSATAVSMDTVRVSPEVARVLALFRGPADGAETDLLLDQNGGVRARFAATDEAGLPDAEMVIADARRVAVTPVAAPSHAGHGQ